jgi:hypothetical protein
MATYYKTSYKAYRQQTVLAPIIMSFPHIIKSIPYSQALRIKRICTDDDTLKEELQNLRGFFFNRNYPTQVVDDAIKRVSNPVRSHVA